VFTLSALRIFAPATGTAILLVAGSILAFFVVGYLTPSPREEEEIEEEQEEEKAPWERAEIPATGAGVPPADFRGGVPTPAGWTSGERLARAHEAQQATGAGEDEERVIRLDDEAEEAPRSDEAPPGVRSGDTVPGRAITGGTVPPVRSGETTSPDAPQ
jgi:hypothetical protein